MKEKENTRRRRESERNRIMQKEMRNNWIDLNTHTGGRGLGTCRDEESHVACMLLMHSEILVLGVGVAPEGSL